MRKPNTYHNLRKIAENKDGGDVFGITIPSIIADQFPDRKFIITNTESRIILIASGCYK